MRGLFKNRFTTLSLSLAAMLVLAACGSSDNGGTSDVPTLTVNVAGDATGSVTSDPPGIDTAANNNSAEFEAGTSVTLMADAEADVLVSWSAEQCDDGAEQCVIEVGEDDQTVTVTFTAVEVEEARMTASSSSEEFMAGGGTSASEGAINFQDDNLELGYEPRENYAVGQIVALRFADAVTGLDLPDGAVVTNAYFEVTAYGYSHADGAAGSESAVQLEVEAADGATDFEEEVGNLSGMTALAGPVAWKIAADVGLDVGESYESDNIASLVNALLEEEVSDFVFLISPAEGNGTAWRSIYSAFGPEARGTDPQNPPQLVVEYYVPGADDGGADEGEGEA